MARLTAFIMFLFGFQYGHCDGCFIEPSMIDRVTGHSGVASTAQKGIIIELPDNREALLLQTTYHGPTERFAWVVPVPAKPGRDDVFLANRDFIDAVFEGSAPDISTNIKEIRLQRSVWEGTISALSAGSGGPPGAAGPGGMGGIGVEPAPTVTVHERMDVGDFDAAILSATGNEVLVDWLQENGFQIPSGAADVFAHYVKQKWHFVALRMRPEKAQEQPVLADVPPIGIRFPTSRLVYPLRISRASSRAKTSLLLCVIAQEPVVCAELPDVALGSGWVKGKSYATLRRKAVERAGRGFIREACFPGGVRYWDMDYEDGKWRIEKRWKDDPWTPANMVTTRLWTILDLSDMEDLYFEADAKQDLFRLSLRRNGAVHYPFAERWRLHRENFTRLGFAPWLCGLAAALVFLAATRRKRALRIRGRYVAPVAIIAFAALVLNTPLGVSIVVIALLYLLVSWRVTADDAGPDAQALSLRERAVGLIAMTGLGMVACAILRFVWLGPMQYVGLDVSGKVAFDYLVTSYRFSDLPANLFLIVPVIWMAATAVWVRGAVAGMGRRHWYPIAAGLVLLAVLLGYVAANWEEIGTLGSLFDYTSDERIEWSSPAMLLTAGGLLRRVFALLTVFAASWAAAAGVIGPVIAPASRRYSRPIGFSLVAVAVVCVILAGPRPGPAFGGMSGGGSGGVYGGLGDALKELDGMLTQFKETRGCYPAELADLVAENPPATGADSSGNVVQIAAPPGDSGVAAGRRRLPVDPLTGRRDTWIYEPTGNPMVDSGGYHLTHRRRAVFRRGRHVDLHTMSYYGMPYWLGDGRAFGFSDDNQPLPASELVGREGWIGAATGLGGPSPHNLLLASVAEGRFRLGYEKVGSRCPLSPDRTEAAMSPRGYGHPMTLILRVSTGGDEWAPLTDHPWTVDAEVVDWHPARDAWLALGREEADLPDTDASEPTPGAGMVGIYLIEPGAEPRQVGGRDYYTDAMFSADGGAILAATLDDRTTRERLDEMSTSYAVDWTNRSYEQGGSSLYRIDLAGGERTKLADNVDRRKLGRSVAVELEGEEPRRILWLTGKRARVVELPDTEMALQDVWADERDLVAAFMGPSRADEAVRTLELWRYVREGGGWQRVARWDLLDENGRPARTDALRKCELVARDSTTGAWLVLKDCYGGCVLNAVGEDGSVRTLRDLGAMGGGAMGMGGSPGSE